jgi:tRNA A-37 threonylcarbamoyl transferase component Bud32
VQHDQLEQALRNFSQVATLRSRRAGLEVWSFAFDGHQYRMHFHNAVRSRIRRAIFGNPAHREFFYLQRLQTLKVPAVHAVALLAGFRIDERVGDGVLIGPIDGMERLDEYLTRLELSNPTEIDTRSIGRQIRQLLREMGHAKLGHRDLSLESFMILDGNVLFYDVGGIHPGFLRKIEVMRLAHSASRFLTRGEVFRFWKELGSGGVPPKRNRAAGPVLRRIAWTCVRGNENVRPIQFGPWKGVFTSTFDRGLRYAAASRMTVSEPDWQRALPGLIAAMDARRFETLKRDLSGEVVATKLELGGESLDIVIKRPRKRNFWRILLDPFRRTRARRAWIKSWKMLSRDIPSEFPLLMIERHRFGFAVEGIVIFERVSGERLDRIDLASLPASRRSALFFRLGRILRQIESRGFSHMDAKSTNWIVHPDDYLAETPVMIDLDSVRHYPASGHGLRRLLRAMKDHPQYRAEDSLEICRGYAPWAKIASSEAPTAHQTEGDSK